jgi:hypothetical protein
MSYQVVTRGFWLLPWLPLNLTECERNFPQRPSVPFKIVFAKSTTLLIIPDSRKLT